MCLLAAACGGQEIDAADRGSASPDLVVANGEQLNGEQLNGAGMGINVAFTSFRGTVLEDGTPLDSASLEGTAFHGLAGSRQFAGADFRQVRFHAVAFDGTPVHLRIANLAQQAPPDDDVWTY